MFNKLKFLFMFKEKPDMILTTSVSQTWTGNKILNKVFIRDILIIAQSHSLGWNPRKMNSQIIYEQLIQPFLKINK